MSEASMPIFGRNVLILWQRLTLVTERVYGYNARSIFLAIQPVETNALNSKIKDLAERTDVLRGYL